MRCLYCGKELALFKRLRGGEFCSDAHRQRYQEEYTQLALNRLLQANSSQDKEAGGANSKESRPAEPESPALKRRERMGREEAPAASPSLSMTPASASLASPVESAVLGTPKQTEAPNQTAVLDREPAPPPARIAATSVVEVTAPAGMSSFLLEFPVAAISETVAIVDASTNLASTPGLTLPRLQEFPLETAEDRLSPAGRVALGLFTLTDFQTPPRERGLELREFVRGVPQVEIRVRPASETGFEPTRETLDVDFVAHPLENLPALWQFTQEELPTLGGNAEVLLGDLARLDYAVIRGDEAAVDSPNAEPPPPPADETPSSEQPSPPANETPEAIGSAGPEPMRVEPIQFGPAPRESSRPEPLRFEPVHIDPVFIEQIAASAEFDALKIAQNEPESSGGPELAELPPSELTSSEVLPNEAPASTENSAEAREDSAAETAPETTLPAETVAAAEPEAPVAAASDTSPPAALTPAAVTKPAPVTLHGLAPARGKPVQAFTSAVFRTSEVQVPRETGLPLRPTMLLGPVPKPTSAPPAPSGNAEKPSGKPAITVPEKRESRPMEVKNRSEVRILPVRVKEEAPSRQKDPVRQAEPAKPELAKDPPAAAALKQGPADKPKAAPPAVEFRPAAPVPAEASPRVAIPQPEPDLLGLPKLSFQNSESFWSRLPVAVRIGAVAAVLALIVGGVILTSRGSGSAKTAAPAVHEPQWVEAGSAIANTAGWAQDWFADRVGSRQGRHVDVLRGSLPLRDYRLVFEGQIEQNALGWVFRANDKSFYVEKIQVVTPGREPVVALVRFAVINGQEQPRTQVPLAIKAHLDTMYKVRMDVTGNRFTTWIQDEQVDQWSDGQIGAGGVGLYYDSGDSAKLKDSLNVIPLTQK
jgi:hypothetical protein